MGEKMVLLEFAMFPTDKGESVSQYVAQIIDYIDRSGVTYQLTPMGTILEGSWDEVMSVVTGCFRLLESQSGRISSSIKIDYRKTNESRMESKIAKVEKLIMREVRK